MKYSSRVLALSVLLAPLCATAGEPLFLQLPVAIDPSAPVPTAVKSDCGVDMLLGNQSLSALTARGEQVQTVAGPEQAGAGKLLQLTIISVHGHGGGSWSGPKSISIRADLKQGAATLGSTVLSRSSSGGAFGGMKGTCSILDRVTVALGKDVAKWLSNRAAGTAGAADAGVPVAQGAVASSPAP